MNKNKKNLLLVLIFAVVAIVILTISIDFLFHYPKNIQCSDGERITINIADFTHQYSQYSVTLEASLNDKTRFAGKLEPVQLQKLSESMQLIVEFRKWLIASYNSCAITKKEYHNIGIRFHNMDVVAQRIDQIMNNPTISQNEKQIIDSLVTQYVSLSREINIKDD